MDQALNPLGLSRLPRRPGFGNALVENISAGCTLVMNAKGRELVLSSLPEGALMHDWWCYLVVSCFGTVLYDPTPQVRYRQHEHNAVGGTSKRLLHLARRAKRFLGDGDRVFRISDQARAFDRCFGERMDLENRAVIDPFLRSRSDFPSRLRYAISPMGVWRQSRVDTLILRILILLGRY